MWKTIEPKVLSFQIEEENKNFILYHYDPVTHISVTFSNLTSVKSSRNALIASCSSVK